MGLDGTFSSRLKWARVGPCGDQSPQMGLDGTFPSRPQWARVARTRLTQGAAQDFAQDRGKTIVKTPLRALALGDRAGYALSRTFGPGLRGHETAQDSAQDPRTRPHTRPTKISAQDSAQDLRTRPLQSLVRTRLVLCAQGFFFSVQYSSKHI